MIAWLTLAGVSQPGDLVCRTALRTLVEPGHRFFIRRASPCVSDTLPRTRFAPSRLGQAEGDISEAPAGSACECWRSFLRRPMASAMRTSGGAHSTTRHTSKGSRNRINP
jgi:hypothetical protein